MKKLTYLFTIILLVALAGCSSSYQSTVQVDEQAAVMLSGNFWNTQLTLDNDSPISLDQEQYDSFELNDKEVIKFNLQPGTRKIKITRGGNTIVLRKVYVSNGNTIEVIVP